MAWTALVLLGYGILNILLGLLGFVRAHSVASLIAGGISGLIVIAAALNVSKRPKVAYGVSAVVALALLGKFVPSLIKEFKIYPAGIDVIASVIALVAAIAGLAAKN
jgi:uncharacterized membrane protein (UPF0136 family)